MPARLGEQHRARAARAPSASSGSRSATAPCEADRLHAQRRTDRVLAAARAVPLVEHQVNHRGPRRRARRALRVPGGRHERDARGTDLALRPHEALRHRRLRQEEHRNAISTVVRPRGSGAAPTRPSASSPTPGGCRRRSHASSVVTDARDLPLGRGRTVVVGRGGVRMGRRHWSAGLRGHGAPQLCGIRFSRRRPRSIALRRAVVRSHAPGHAGTPCSGQVRIAWTTASLGEIEVARVARERHEDPRAPIRRGRPGRAPGDRPLERHMPGMIWTGRTSTEPCAAPGILAAHPRATSRSAQSTR